MSNLINRVDTETVGIASDATGSTLTKNLIFSLQGSRLLDPALVIPPNRSLVTLLIDFRLLLLILIHGGLEYTLDLTDIDPRLLAW